MKPALRLRVRIIMNSMIEWVEYLRCNEIEGTVFCDFSTWYSLLVGLIVTLTGIAMAFGISYFQIKKSGENTTVLEKIGEIHMKINSYKNEYNRIAKEKISTSLYDIRNVLFSYSINQVKNQSDDYLMKTSISTITTIINISSSYLEPPEQGVDVLSFCNNLNEMYFEVNNIDHEIVNKLKNRSEDLLRKYHNEFFEEKIILSREIKQIDE